MRLSQAFLHTRKEDPKEAEAVSHKLLLRSGMVYPVTGGVYAYLPLGLKVIEKVKKIIEEEMDKIGAQELLMPHLQPLSLWQKTGRDDTFGQNLFSLCDRKGFKLCLGPTHEEVVTEIAHSQVKSYRDLPLLLYQVQTKFRDEARPRGGILRAREFMMMDAYSFDTEEARLDEVYHEVINAYKQIFQRLELPVVTVEADSGAIGGKESHEFIALNQSGEDRIIYCEGCGYAANEEKAEGVKSDLPAEPLYELEELATPDMRTIDEISSFLQVPPEKTLKALFYSTEKEIVFAIIRGDLRVNEVKLRHVLGSYRLQLATDEEVRNVGLIPGFASPVGLSEIKIVADDSITKGQNFIAGANKPDFHLKNVNYPRDFRVDLISDIALASAGQGCPCCGKKLNSQQGIELGHVFKLGTIFSESLSASFLDSQGKQRAILMGCYGLGVDRMVAAVIEQNHDGKGIIWPHSISPYQVYLCALGMDNPEVRKESEGLYSDLLRKGAEVLFDDRLEPPGVKFNDADLLGIPLRVTVSPRTLKTKSAEIKRRTSKDSLLVLLPRVAEEVETTLFRS
jgi:prolyl-tRNA synthetase